MSCDLLLQVNTVNNPKEAVLAESQRVRIAIFLYTFQLIHAQTVVPRSVIPFMCLQHNYFHFAVVFH